MAQGVVTNFFSSKKRADPFQASKRRKVLKADAGVEDKLSSAGATDFKGFADVVESSKLKLKQNSEGLTTPQFCFSLKTVEPVSKTNTSQSLTDSKTNNSVNTKRRASTRNRASTRKKSVSHGPMDRMLEKAKNKKNSSEEESTDSSTNGDAEVTSVSDDHNTVLPKSLPGTPTKRSQQNSEAPIRRKRRKPVASNEVDPKKAESTETEVVKSNRPKKSVSSKSKGSVKKSLDKTFQKYEKEVKEKNIDTVKKEKDDSENTSESATPEPTSNSRRKVQSKNNPTKLETNQKPSRSRTKKTTKDDDSSTSVDSERKPDEQKAATNPLGDRIRSTLQEHRSPVKQDTPVSTSKATKGKLTPAMVKERLAKSGKLAELQSRLAQIKECANQAKKESKVGTQKVAVRKEQEKPATKSIPAYQKYHSLASPAPPSLTLPFKFKTLEQMFHSVDTVVSLLHNRKETCTFPKLKSAVQEMCRKTFELRNVGQIKRVYPTSYFFSQQKQTTKQRMNTKPSESSYQLMVQPNLDSDGMSSNGNNSSEVSSQAMQGVTTSLMKKFTPSMLIARRTIFHNSLIDIVKQHHKEFLSKLDRPLTVQDDKIARWHPKFPLDSVPEVEPSSLPEPPAVKTYNNAKDVLDKARHMMTPRVAKALETVAKNSEMLKSAKNKPASTATLSKLAPQSSKGQGSSQGPSGVQGINQSLLERIRAKEAQKQVSAMMRNPEDEKRIARLERLPGLCRILRVFFLAEKKAALIYDVIVKKLGDSSKSSLTKAEVEKHLDLMIEILPTWLTVHNIRKEKYIKMNKMQDINDVIAKVNKIYKESK